MNYTKHLSIPVLAFIALGSFTACEAEIDRALPDPDVANGNADFTTYVALGNSLTAGYADGALNRAGQENSYPAIMAEQMLYIQPELEFNQPLLPAGTANGTLQLTGFTFTPDGRPLPTIVPETSGLSTNEIYARAEGSTFQNLGVPGAKVGHLIAPGFGNPAAGEGNYNPYFTRFATDPASSSVVEMAAAQSPSFFTLWIGNNDVLGFATTGGDSNNPNDEITPSGQFETYYRMLIGGLVSANPDIEGAIATIPDVSKVPFFTAVKWNDFRLTQEQADALNAGTKIQIEAGVQAKVDTAVYYEVIPAVAYGAVYQQAYEGAYNQAKTGGATDEQADAIATEYAQTYVESPEGKANIQNLIESLRTSQQPEEAYAIVQQKEDSIFNANIDYLIANKFYPQFQMGPNGFVVEEENSPTGIRQLNETDLVTLKLQSATPEEFNPTAENPADVDISIPAYYVLDAGEQAEVSTAISEYNAVIKNIADENTFALVDVNAFFNDIVDANGYSDDGTTFTNAFITGNAFSLDGIHLTQKGYALVAKKFIQSINTFYGSKIPEPNLRLYPAVGLPN